ncbi:BTAD domain-containing putative transcriptional regulator [Micromonospora sp. NPDC049257]|uniref:BTAD domain-containing putative transcriptional regulator n=1 Tax=Micromonospora sp. NPDC049257 TaxID=3155771 RepID=UPI00343B7FF7
MGLRTTARVGRALTGGAVISAPALLLYGLGRSQMRWPTGDEARAWIAQPLTPNFLAILAIAVGWAIWALLATTILTHLSDRVGRRLRRVAPLRLPGPLQGLTAALLGATAVTAGVSGTAPAVLAATATDFPDSTPPPASSDRDARTAHASAKPQDGDASSRRTVTVRRGDTLSAIAARRLDDADRWRDIYSLNRGARFTTGSLTDPDLIQPGWKLRLPTPANAPAPRPSSRPPRPAPDTTPDKAPNQPDTNSPSTAPTTTQATPIATGSDEVSADCDRPGVSLGDRGWIDAALAAILLAAGTLAYAHRGHRHTPPRDPSPGALGHDPQRPPLPPLLAHIRRALPRLTPTSTPAPSSGTLDRPSRPTTPTTVSAAASADLPFVDTGPVSTSASRSDRHGSPGVVAAVPAPTGQVASGVWPAAGRGLTGPAAYAAARGYLVSALATGTPDRPGHVVIPAATLAILLEDHTHLVGDLPHLTVTSNLSDALTVVEEQILHRTRICLDYQVDTITVLHEAHPSAEALPPLLLIADTTEAHERASTAALLTQGQHLDIQGVLLGAWPHGDTLAVDVDGTTTAADSDRSQEADLAKFDRLTVLTAADTIDLLTTLTDTHPGPHQFTARSQYADTQEPRTIPPVSRPEADADPPTGDEAPPVPVATPVAPTNANLPQAPSPAADGQPELRGGQVGVQILGGAQIVGRDTGMPLRAKALELLVYLTVHDGEATQDAILDDLLPDAPAAKAPHRLHTYVSALRKTLTRTGGHGTYLTHPTHRYALNRQHIDTDLWRMRAALRDAALATDDADRLDALRRAVDAYGGPLADGFDYEWIEAHREGIRRQALDAHLALATTTPDPDEARTVLQAAIRHDPYAEPLYQQAMRTHAALGHLGEVHALRQSLTRRLAEIDAEPSTDTLALADQLTAGPPPHRPADHPRTRGNGPQR